MGEFWYQDEELCDALVLFLREVTAIQLENKPDDYLPFLDLDQPDPLAKRAAFVRGMGNEAIDVEILALMDALQFGCEILLLDRADPVVQHLIPHKLEQLPPTFVRPVFLYRPGHYDLLYQG